MAIILGSAHLEVRKSSIEAKEGADPGMGLFSKVALKKDSLIPYYGLIVKNEPIDPTYTITVGKDPKVDDDYFYFSGNAKEYRRKMMAKQLGSMTRYSMDESLAAKHTYRIISGSKYIKQIGSHMSNAISLDRWKEDSRVSPHESPDLMFFPVSNYTEVTSSFLFSCKY